MLVTLMRSLIFVLTAGAFIQSCTQKDIQFGDNPETSYTNIIFTDTISVSLSTVLLDSFVTNNATSYLLGRYKDPYLGMVAAKNFFQMTIPASVPVIPTSARYDSLTFIFRPNEYYYGDTTTPVTVYVNELAQPIAYSYNNSLYNTSAVPVKSVPLGSKTIRIRPIVDDSVEIRLSDVKGSELFARLMNQSTDVANADNFLNYFKGISLTIGDRDTSTIYGLKGANGVMVMRVHYHTTVPHPVNEHIDFTSMANEYSFNQVLPTRSGTSIVPGVEEINAAQTNNRSFLQPGTGLYLKMIFPSLRSVSTTDKIMKLLKAELIIRPSPLSFDKNKYRLPSQLYLTQTDGSNISGSAIPDETGTSVQYASPVVDELYGENSYYRFNVTPYINQLLTTAGSEDNGFFLMHDLSASSMNVTRLIVNNSFHGVQSSKLLLSFIVINK